MEDLISQGEEERRESAVQQSPTGFSRDNQPSASHSYISSPTGQRLTVAENLTFLPNSSLLSATYSSSSGNQCLVMENEQLTSECDRHQPSFSAGKISGVNSKSVRKSRAKSTRRKLHGSPILALDDEDEDNDFIPVGMLQLPTWKIPKSTDTVNPSSVNNTDVQYHLSQGFDLKCDQQDWVRDDHSQHVEKSNQKERNEFLQEELKQLLEDRLQLQSQQQEKEYVPKDKQQIHKLFKVSQQHNEYQHARNFKFQQETQSESDYQHQSLVQLIQAQQLHRKLQGHQQQEMQQLQSSLHKANSDIIKPVSTVKNQGVIITHHQADKVSVASDIPNLNQHSHEKSQGVEFEDDGNRQHQPYPQNFEQSTKPAFQFQCEELNNTMIKQNLLQNVHQYSEQTALYVDPVESHIQIKQESVTPSEESLQQVQSSNIPTISEQLLLQSNTMKLPQYSNIEQHESRSQQLLMETKTDHLLQPLSWQADCSKLHAETFSPLTPICASFHHPELCEKQQRPEIARMLNSPVNLSQLIRPRECASPHPTVSPNQSSSIPSHYISFQHPVSSQSQKCTGSTYLPSFKPTVSLQPFSSDHMNKKRQTASPQFSSNPSQPSPTSPVQLVNTEQTRLHTGQSKSYYVSSDTCNRHFEHTTFVHNQSVSLPSEKPGDPISKQQQQSYDGNVQQVTSDAQYIHSVVSTNVSSNDNNHYLSLAIPLNLHAESLSSDQVIYHHPLDPKNAQSKVSDMQKSQPSQPIQRPSPVFSSMSVSTPTTISNNSTAEPLIPSQNCRSQINKESNNYSLVHADTSSSMSAGMVKLDDQQNQEQQSTEPSDKSVLVTSRTLEDRSGHQRIPSGSFNNPMTKALTGESPASEQSDLNPLPNIDKHNALHEKVSNSEVHTDTFKEARSIRASISNKLKVTNSSVSFSEISRREVRQRKPKKPFDQEDTLLKHNLRTLTPSMKNAVSSASSRRLAPTQNPFHIKDQGRESQAKSVKRREVVEQEDVKLKSTPVIRLLAEGTETKNKDRNKKTSGEVEGILNAELQTPSRRLSRRLQVKEEEHLKNDNNTDVSMSKQLSRRSSGVNYKDKFSSGDGIISSKDSRYSRQTCFSTAADNRGLFKTPKRMTTRRRHDGSFRTNDKRTDKVSTINSRSNMTGRNKSRSLTHDIKSRSYIQQRNSSSLTQKRRITRHTAVQLGSLRSHTNTEIKRKLPSEFANELPPWRKYVKKIDTSKTKEWKIEGLGEKSKDVKGKTSDVNSKTGIADNIEGTLESKSEITAIKSKKTKKRRNTKKSNSRLKKSLPTTVEDSERSSSNHGESNENSAKSQNSPVSSFMEKVDNVEQICGTTEVIMPNTNIAKSRTVGQKDVLESDINFHESEFTNDGPTDLDLQKSATNAKLQSESDNMANQTLAIFTANYSELEAKTEKFVQATVSTSASVETCLLPCDNRTSHASERQKMVMFRLVPVLDDDISDVEASESLVQVIGYFVQGGSNDRILLPQNFMHGPVTTKAPSSATEAVADPLSVLISARQSAVQPLPTPPMSITSPSNMVPDDTLSEIKTSKSALKSDLLSLGNVALTYSPSTTTLCTTGASTIPMNTRTLPAHLSTVSSAAEPAIWTPNLPHPPPTPPPSVGEPTVVVSKNLWTNELPQASPLQYKPSPSWNTTPPSSSPLPSSSSSSAWNFSSFTPLPPPSSYHQLHQQHYQSWAQSSQPSLQELSLMPSHAAESNTTNVFSDTVYSSMLNSEQKQEKSMDVGSFQHIDASTQNMLEISGFNTGTDTSHQPIVYVADQDHSMNSGILFSTNPAQDSEFADSRPDKLIQSLLRQISSNPVGLSQELAEFNLGQQDIAFLECLLRQDLSPSTLLSAVMAYDNIREHDMEVSCGNSTQEGNSLVHTVNLDTIEGNLHSSANHQMPELRFVSATCVSEKPENSDAEDIQLNRGHRGDIQASFNNNDVCGDLSESPQKCGSGEPKSDGKKKARERKSQYKIVLENDIKKYKCLICGKSLGPATIYRHLRVHDPDYKVWCKLCGKQYTQRHSLNIHQKKCHADQISSATLVKGTNCKELSDSEQNVQRPLLLLNTPWGSHNAQPQQPDSPLESSDLPLMSSDLPLMSSDLPLRSPDSPQRSSELPLRSSDKPLSSSDALLRSPGAEQSLTESPLRPLDLPQRLSGAPEMSRGPLNKSQIAVDQRLTAPTVSDHTGVSYCESELQKKQTTQSMQVEELRKMKAKKKKLAAAQRKLACLAEDKVVAHGDTSQEAQLEANVDKVAMDHLMGNSNVNAGFADEQMAPSSVVINNHKTTYHYSISTDSQPAISKDYTSKMVAQSQGNFENDSSLKFAVVPKSHFQLNSPKPIMSTLPQFQSSKILNPISAPSTKSSCNVSETEFQIKTAAPEEGTHARTSTEEPSAFVKDSGKYVCEICNTSLSSRSGYFLHMRRHSNIKTKFCAYCKKGFHTGQEVKSHERIHTGEKPFKCDICYTAFAYSGSYVSHKKSHERRGEREPFLIIDGTIQYPSHFMKPRSRRETGSHENPPKNKKMTQQKLPPIASDLEYTGQIKVIQQSHFTEGNILDDDSVELLESSEEDTDMSITSQKISLNDENPKMTSFNTSMDWSALNDQSINLRMAKLQSKTSEERDHGEYVPSGDNYTSSENVSLDYYNNPSGYNERMPQRALASTQMETLLSSQDYNKHDNYFQMPPGVNTYPPGSQYQAVLPVTSALEKSLDKGDGDSLRFSENVHDSSNYFSTQENPNDCQFSVPPQGVEQNGCEDSLAYGMGDSSLSEIVNKLLQHYNVNASTHPDTKPLDCSHQTGDMPE